MERRYDLLAEYGVRDITGFNEAYDRGDLGPASSHRCAAGPRPWPTRSSGRAGPVRRRGGRRRRHRRARRAVSSVERLPFILVVVDELKRPDDGAARDRRRFGVRNRPDGPGRSASTWCSPRSAPRSMSSPGHQGNVPSRMAFSVSSLPTGRVHLGQPRRRAVDRQGRHVGAHRLANIPRRLQARGLRRGGSSGRGPLAGAQVGCPSRWSASTPSTTSPGRPWRRGRHDELLAVAMEAGRALPARVRPRCSSVSLRVGFPAPVG